MSVNIRCIQVAIVDDTIIEANETVSVILRETTTNSITFTIESAEITIVDNDCKYKQHNRTDIFV